MKALKVVLEQVTHQLVHLELEIIDQSEVHSTFSSSSDKLDDSFTPYILGLRPNNRAQILPALQVL
jgi:hypothetical protein